MQAYQQLSTRISKALTPLRSRLGAFGWGVLVVFLIQRGADIANVVCKIFLGRVLPPLDFGAVEPIGATVAMLSLPPAIIYGAAVKSISRLRSQGEEAQCRALIQDLQIVALVGSTLSVIIVFILRNFILTRLHLESSFFIWMIALMFAMAWWAPLALSIIRAEHNYKLLLVNGTISPVLLVALTVILVANLNLGLKGAIAARVLGSLLVLSFLFLYIRHHHSGTKEPYSAERAAMLKMLFPMSIVVFSSTLAINFDRLFVRNFMLQDSPGLSAIFMLGQIPRLAITPLIFVLFPVAAAQHASGKELGRLLRNTVFLTSLVIAGFCVTFSIIATPLLHLWRPEFAPYGQYVWIYALMTGLHSLNAVIAQVELARHAYRFLWFHAIPITLACGGIYILQNFTAFRFTLPQVLWTLTAAQILTTISTTAYIHFRPKRP